LNQTQVALPQLFKGIALFTPGGDLIYCIDSTKEGHWHLHLCVRLQELLSLPEPPHFLVPCYTATIDRWLDPRSQHLCIAAEASPTVLRHQTLLNAIFGTEDLVWQPAPWVEGMCDPLVLDTYRDRFPQLWTEHDLIVRFDRTAPSPPLPQSAKTLASENNRPLPQESQRCVLRLFVSGHSAATKRTLQRLHQLLEQSMPYPYTLKVIDIFKHPEQAEQDQVAATPTLVRIWPHPIRRIVGSLEDVDKVLRILGVSET